MFQIKLSLFILTYLAMTTNLVYTIVHQTLPEVSYFMKQNCYLLHMSYSLCVRNLTKKYVMYLISLFRRYIRLVQIRRPEQTVAFFRLILSTFRNEFLSTFLLISSISLLFDFGHVLRSLLSNSFHNSSIGFFKYIYLFWYSLKYFFGLYA